MSRKHVPAPFVRRVAAMMARRPNAWQRYLASGLSAVDWSRREALGVPF